MNGPQSGEQRVLRVSLLASLVLAVVAVIWGLAAGAQIILLDGVYLLLGSALSGLSLLASRRAAEGPTLRFPFGRESLVPLAIGIQGMALLATCVYAALEAVRTILDGGTDVAVGSVAVYALLTTLAALVLYRYVRGRQDHSDLLDAEARQWRSGGVLSVVVLAGTVVVLLLRAASWDAAERYVDPVLVLIACVLLLPEPVHMVRTTVVELLEGAPERGIVGSVEQAAEQVRVEYGLDQPVLRVGKVGRKLYVEAEFIVPDGSWDIADEDRVRRALAERLAELPFAVWLNLEMLTSRR
jgi:cation diffusion facilitator family transporter